MGCSWCCGSRSTLEENSSEVRSMGKNSREDQKLSLKRTELWKEIKSKLPDEINQILKESNFEYKDKSIEELFLLHWNGKPPPLPEACEHSKEGQHWLRVTRATTGNLCFGYLIQKDYTWLYEGLLKDGKIFEYGRHISYDGTIYIGKWQNGKRHGSGKTITPNGDIYSGNYEDDLLQGYGKIEYKDKKIFTGEFVRGKRHGKGTLVFPKSREVEGEFENDTPPNKGTIKFKNGSLFEGELDNFEMHGHGKLIESSGGVQIVKEGAWDHGTISKHIASELVESQLIICQRPEAPDMK